ncbi:MULTISPECIES: TRAP transporter substrate-binding protein [unclassified Bradyrhizobium]|uniref:TRAP transporter substrate-binding protein n=1 Tax=unclassified Bradyrhizobium TaxID=2631580 RepID=UPI0028E2203E|nr:MULTISPECIES: TRAP transporter substrate-binding protein [unclassified Bradyrhizobium]
MRKGKTRRQFLAGTAALPFAIAVSRYAKAAEFTMKLATGQDPSHPVNKRAQQAADRIKEASGGRLEINLYPANQLGSDTDLISQVRVGAVDAINISSSVLATRVPLAGIVNTGFAFTSYDQVWKAMDGNLGDHIRKDIEKTGAIALSKPWDNGFRQVTSSTREIKTPDDLKSFKIRVPAAPILTSLFQALGAGPTPINFNEVYTALQTKVVEGQENPLPIIATAKLYEVQKYCSLTSHVWDAYWILGNRAAFGKLPSDLQTLVLREFSKSADDERADIAALSQSLRADLAAKGFTFIDVDKSTFRAVLAKSSFYKDWRGRFGEEAWTILQSNVGELG